MAGFHEYIQVSFNSEYTAPIHLAAADGLTELINNTSPGSIWADAIPTWRRRAASHESYTMIDPSAIAVLGPQLPRC
jgi:hypothetical protein